MSRRIGWSFVGATCAVVGCAQILGIEDLPPLRDGGTGRFDASPDDAGAAPTPDASGGDAALADAAARDGGDAPVGDAGGVVDAPVADAPAGPPCLTNPDYVDGPGNGHRYRLVQAAATWAAARQACDDDGGYLVVIGDMSENGHVGTVGNGLNRWIGLSDVDTEGELVWVTGAPSSYRNWQGGSPNNSDADDCVRMKGNGQWDVRSCAETNPFVCECDPDWAP